MNATNDHMFEGVIPLARKKGYKSFWEIMGQKRCERVPPYQLYGSDDLFVSLAVIRLFSSVYFSLDAMLQRQSRAVGPFPHLERSRSAEVWRTSTLK